MQVNLGIAQTKKRETERIAQREKKLAQDLQQLAQEKEKNDELRLRTEQEKALHKAKKDCLEAKARECWNAFFYAP